MHIISLDAISVPPTRQRQKFDETKLKDLKQSILDNGLLNPPTFVKNEHDVYILVAGERRLKAIQMLAKENISFICNQQSIAPGSLPILLLAKSDKLSRTQAELEENLMREDLTWAERTAALAAFHALRTGQDQNATQKSVATELAAKRISGNPSEGQIGTIRNEIRRAVVVAEHLHRPEIANARSEAEAYQLVLKSEAEAFEAELIRRKKLSVQTELRCEIRHGDALEMMKKLDDNQIDLILSDPPYGVNANSAGYRSRTMLHHTYDDSEQNAREILEALLVEGWRISKLQANIFIFTDIKHFEWLCVNSSRMGWQPWRFPIIWQKSISEGLVPWGKNGFVHTYDIGFWATKGRRGTNRTEVDVLTYSRVARSERIYAAEKPLPLLQTIIDLMTQPGDLVFDPCAGSGSTLLAAKTLKRHSFGFEINKAVCDMATVRINDGDEHADFTEINKQLMGSSSTPSDEIPANTSDPVSLEETSLPGGLVDL